MTGEIRSILVATDLGETSDRVLQAAAALAEVTGADLHLVTVDDAGKDGAGDEGRPARRSTDPERLMEAQVRRTVKGRAPASLHVARGRPFREIVGRAEAVGADLLVLGRHARRRMGDRILGSTADRVVRTSPGPVLLVNGPLQLPLRRIVVPVDLSENSAAALGAAFRLGLATGSASGERGVVEVIHAAPETPEDPRQAGTAPQRLRNRVEEFAEADERSHHFAVRPWVTRGGPPAELLLEHIGKARPDVVVMGTHGRGDLARALVGSVASRLAREADVPVLLVPPAGEGG